MRCLRLQISTSVVCLLCLFVRIGALATDDQSGDVKGPLGSRQDRSRMLSQGRMFGYRNMLSCGLSLNGACFLDAAEDVLLQKHASLLAEADKYAVEHSSRESSSEEINSPSELVDSISLIFLEIRDLFKGGLTGLFRDAKEDALDDEDGEDVTQEQDGALDDGEGEELEGEEEEESAEKEGDNEEKNSRRLGVEERGKKKKKKLKSIIKLLVLGAVFFAKITLLLKVLAAHLQIKFLLIAFGGLLLNVARFYFDLKKGHSPQKVIYYEHAQHQHHYDGGEDDWSGAGGGHGGGHGGYWGRSYVVPDDGKTTAAQDLAYAQQKPLGTQYARVEDKPNFSWE